MLKWLYAHGSRHHPRRTAPAAQAAAPAAPDRTEELIRILTSIDTRLKNLELCVGHSSYGGRGHYVKIMNATNN
jgi:hypothetical protein